MKKRRKKNVSASMKILQSLTHAIKKNVSNTTLRFHSRKNPQVAGGNPMQLAVNVFFQRRGLFFYYYFFQIIFL